MCQKFNMRMPNKAELVMELFGEIKSLEKAPVRQQLLGGSNVTMHSLNNKMKKCIHIPQCIDDASVKVASVKVALRKYQILQQIVETVDGGAKSPDKGLRSVLFGLGKGS
jgi:hypothetical protein